MGDEDTCPLEDRTEFTTNNADASSKFILAHNIRQALLDLPNGAVTGEDVDPRTGEKDGEALKVECTNMFCNADSNNEGTWCTDNADCPDGDGTGACAASQYGAECDISMNSKHNSGDLSNKMECWSGGCKFNGKDDTAN